MAPEVDSSAQSAAPTPVTAPGEGGAPLQAENADSSQLLNDITNNSSAPQPAAPARQPTVPIPGSTGFAASTGFPGGSSSEASAFQSAVAMEALNKHLHGSSSNSPSTKPEEGTAANDPTSRPNSSGSAVASGAPNSSLSKKRAMSPAELNETAATKDDSSSHNLLESCAQRDLAGVDEDKAKIAVVLEFSLHASAYATVVLRELMAEVEPVDEGSPLYPPSNAVHS